jgi:RHS repeat-associated protein
LTDPTGAVTDTYDYDAWGNAVNVTGLTPNLYRYRGEQYDPDLNLYYLRMRYFNPLTGRFLTRDLYESCGCTVCGRDPATSHKYLYAAVDPVNKLDPTGRQSVAEESLLIGGVTVLFASAAYWEYKTHVGAEAVRAFWYSAARMIECLNKLARDMKACADAYPPGPARQACFDAARAAYRRCLGEGLN